MQRIPTLVGTGGHYKGEMFKLPYGRPVTVGRSRTADFCLRRTQAYKAQTEAQREADEPAQTVSHKHFQVTMFNLNSIEIKNISPNGTRLDGRDIKSTVINDVSSRAHEIRFGTEEVLRLEMREHEDD